ncbi:CMP-N,N'-diacetyllegionaminic acid synthase [Desulfatibacillum alkenivorans DSM 16219]|jgi:CMP-N-acetylneuraminic acid synthetase|uniref:CMP-N,N'-diacetyllegionaminic acid synthase n=1 Tax=Desulfatibacillum alkenivorans DSM 16219 TaxID=1121393 RepID=A0A1M6RXT7_9BACT|nr:acylneuraminate cytidylyltransferase family protein [Desulfatibacillum alkenivorans]SHK37260.1 CMP-N,N'-diacetyllegionaminic acid synthase [Desulfatibacillum alkenivorans DSM 16219]
MSEDYEILGLIPARGGSKSLHKKNIALLGGHPLLTWVARAGKQSQSLSRILCSTDDEDIASVCREHDIEVAERPPELGQDDTHIVDVMVDLVKTLEEREGYRPKAVALLQPTSPFLLAEHVDDCCRALMADPKAHSAQTISRFPSIFHAFNQRIIEDEGYVRFRYMEERKVCYNKQRKPEHFILGNFIVTTTEALINEREVFALPSIPVEVPYSYALDVDGPEDFETAEWYLKSGKVKGFDL